MNNLRPNYQRAKIAIILIWVMLGLEIISFISGYFQYRLLQTLAKGGQISETTATLNDMRERVIGILYALAFVISAITFIQWFRRAYFNLHQIIEEVSYTEGMAAGSWFIPIINLYRPYQIMQELYRKTKSFLAIENINFSPPKSYYLGWWWTLWIISNVIGQASFRISLRAESIEELTNSTAIGMIDNIMGVPLALITIKIIKDYAILESLFFEMNKGEDNTTHNNAV